MDEGWQTQATGAHLLWLYSKLRAIKSILKTKQIEVFGGLRESVGG